MTQMRQIKIDGDVLGWPDTGNTEILGLLPVSNAQFRLSKLKNRKLLYEVYQNKKSSISKPVTLCALNIICP